MAPTQVVSPYVEMRVMTTRLIWLISEKNAVRREYAPIDKNVPESPPC